LAARNPKDNREFVKILMLNREYPVDHAAEAINMAMAYNVYSYDGVLNILMQLNAESSKISYLRSDKIANIPHVNG